MNGLKALAADLFGVTLRRPLAGSGAAPSLLSATLLPAPIASPTPRSIPVLVLGANESPPPQAASVGLAVTRRAARAPEAASFEISACNGVSASIRIFASSRFANFANDRGADAGGRSPCDADAGCVESVDGAAKSSARAG